MLNSKFTRKQTTIYTFTKGAYKESDLSTKKFPE